MKKKNLLLLLVPVAAMMLTLVGCSDYDNGFTESVIKFDKNFSDKFASIDPEQDWNLAERASLTVISSTPREIMIYSEMNGTYYILGDFEGVTGTQELSFDTYEGTTMVVVSDGETAMRAFVGGTVNFDDNTSVADKVQETRSHDVNRNEYEKKGYIIPANITDEEREAVIEAFSIPHYGAVNTVTIPWETIWVQQVYRSGYEYTAGNGGTVTGSDHMDHLQLYNNNVTEDATKGGRYEHVNDFNAADHNSSWQDIVGLTLMYNIDATNVVTEEITNVYGQKVNWVKQWAYNNTEDSKYHCDYIYKMVNGNLYIGFDFYSHHGDGEADNKNEDVERDWVFNDWILKVAPAMGTNVPQEDIPDASPLAWVLACEDLGSTDDIDYNDVVVKVEHEAGQEVAYITPLAAGGTLASYLYFTSTTGNPVCVGEIHRLFNLSSAVSGSYPAINVGSETASAPQRYPITVGKDWSIACYSTTEWDASKQTTGSNMGGFSIKVLPKGTATDAWSLKYDSELYEDNKPSIVQSPEPGTAPYILCLPSSYIKMSGNTKTANPWCWPGERKYINDAYSTFGGWVEDHNTNKDWYTHPNSSYVVNASAIPTISSTIVSEVVNDEFDQETLATITTLYNVLNVPTWVRTEIPSPTLTLKEGISEILIAPGETIDLYDYINTNFPIYCTLSETGDINYANSEHTSVMGVGQGGKTVTITIHQYSKNGATLNVTARTVRAYHYDDNSGTIEMDGKTIEIGAGQTYYIGTEWDNNYVSFECTKNNNNISTNINGNSVEVIAGNNVGAETTLTFTFTSKNNSSQSKTLTANFKVVESNNGGNGNEGNVDNPDDNNEGDNPGDNDEGDDTEGNADYGTPLTVVKIDGNRRVYRIQDVLDIAGTDGSVFFTVEGSAYGSGMNFYRYDNNNGLQWGEVIYAGSVAVATLRAWQTSGYEYFCSQDVVKTLYVKKNSSSAKKRRVIRK